MDQLYIDTAFKTPRLIEKREMMFGDMSRTGVPFSKDPHVVYHGGRYLMYYSIPPKKGDEKSGWNIGIVESRDLIDWKQPVDAPILFPQLPWEGECIEGASITIQNNKMYMFYAGAYNNWPQQVGVAVSDNGLTWKRVFDEPFLSPKEWMIALESLKYTNV
ncbi:MAG: hypothetical protein LBB62_01600 [Proteiniphilum sp.]|nr:hypothetical protein [Proteiniphilum sp.]